MTGPDAVPGTLLTEWARLLLGSLRQAGVRDVVVSPGSRSTPFTWAALREPGLRCHTLIDERAAGFFAVGHAKLTGRPVLLICTSGSAAANYFPAVVEASESGTPLLLLTADRPLELQHASAPQTIDQVKLYGAYAREYLDLGTPEPHPWMLRALQRLAAQAVRSTGGPAPGPVHLNARARKPLEPVDPEDDAAADGASARRLRAEVDALLQRGVARSWDADAAPSRAALDDLAGACRAARRGLIVCGPATPARAADPAAVAALARATGFPVVAEPASQQRFAAGVDAGLLVDAFDLLLAAPAFREAHGPDLVLHVGRPPTASAWNDYLARWPDAARYILAPDGWPDPWSTATAVVRSPLDPALRALADALEGDDADDDGPTADSADSAAHPAVEARAAWREALRSASRTAWRAVDRALADGFSEGAAVRAVVDAVPAGGVLALGNSLPIREVGTFVPAGDRGLTVWAQRGANGIDGLMAGAAGAAAGSGRPTTLLLGDVSFAHDVGGLAAARGLEVPLTIVVLNNGGGRIFERLPIASRLEGDPALDAWLTPPALDVAAAAAAYGLAFARATDLPGLTEALESAARGGVTVVEVVVPEGGTTAHQEALRRRLDADLRG